MREVLAGQSGRLAHTLRIILTKPGDLAREVDEGRDSISMRPLTLLFHLAALFFLVSTFTGFGVDVIVRADGSGAFAGMIERHPMESHVPSAAFSICASSIFSWASCGRPRVPLESIPSAFRQCRLW